MRVSHILFSMKMGGAQALVVDLANLQIQREGWKVEILVINDEEDESLISSVDPRVKVVRIARRKGSRGIIPLMKLWWFALSRVRAVLHFHDETIARVLPVRFMKNAVLTVHDVRFERDLIQRFPNLCAISETVAEMVRQCVPVSKAVSVILNGVRRVTASDGFKLDQGPSKAVGTISILQVARLMMRKKGQDFSISLLKQLLANGHNVELTFVGDGEDRGAIEEMVRANELQGRVTLLGSLPREDVLRLYREFDLLVHPAVYEGFGLTIVEAMMAGLAVLVPNGSGPSEIIENGALGYQYISGNLESAAEMFELYISDRATGRLSQIKLKAASRAVERFSIEQNERSYAKLYELLRSEPA